MTMRLKHLCAVASNLCGPEDVPRFPLLPRAAPCLVSPPPRLPRPQQLVCFPGLGSGLRKLALGGHVSVRICPGRGSLLTGNHLWVPSSMSDCESWDGLKKGLGNGSKPEQGWRGKRSEALSDPGAGEALGV